MNFGGFGMNYSKMLRAIRDKCLETEKCSDCPFRGVDDKCMFVENAAPATWELVDDNGFVPRLFK